MAYNEISVPHWQNLVRRVFGLTGAGGNVPLLAPEIQPVAIIQPATADQRIYRGETPFATALETFLPAAGNRAAIQMRNDSDSGRMVIIEICKAFAVGGVRPAFSLTELDLAVGISANSAFVRDSRRQPPGVACITPALLFSYKDNSAVTEGTCLAGGPDGEGRIEMRDIVLMPGAALLVNAFVLATKIGVYVEWYEKPFDVAEGSA